MSAARSLRAGSGTGRAAAIFGSGLRSRRRADSSLGVLRCVRMTTQRSARVSGRRPMVARTLGHQQEKRATAGAELIAGELMVDGSRQAKPGLEARRT